MLKIMPFALAAGLALASLAAPAAAFEIPAAPALAADVQHVDFICGPGEHIGYEGRHCWGNRGGGVAVGGLSIGGLSIGFAACPPGTHPGYRDRFCWPNRR